MSSSKLRSDIHKESKALESWFQENSRPLPWRESRDPYRIWISEIMLQQTTVKAVIPFFEKFMDRFPKLEDLANATIEDVYERWAGLGYYSRARNIHKAAKELSALGNFPQTYVKLIELPGLGDYTARAISSQAFGERAGVVDGNVIRVLSRRFGEKFEHWKTADKKQLQQLADQYVVVGDPSTINQALMEVGSTICTPTNPSCLLCPLKKNCVALKNDLIEQLPLKKPRKTSEIWVWQAEIIEKNGKVAFVENHYAPFLKKALILPGSVEKKAKAPKDFNFQHAITHHKIYVQVVRRKPKASEKVSKSLQWVGKKQLKEKVPFSLIQKALEVPLN